MKTDGNKAQESPIGKNDAPHGTVVVGIGASAGGLEALEQFFQNTPPDSGMAFVIITHLDPTHRSMLVEIIGRYTTMEVRTIEEGMPVQPNHVYIIPSDEYACIRDNTLHLVSRKDPPEKKMPIDLFFRSLASAKGEDAVAIVLSGTATDGSLGVKDIKEHLGLVIAQDLMSAKYEGMPKSAVETGVVDYVLSPSEMPAQLIRYLDNRATLVKGEREKGDERSEAIKRILSLVRAQTGNDFSDYKTKTIDRRVERRMDILGLNDLSAYVGYLSANPGEVEQLQKDLLISVTRFFRDPEAFVALKQRILNDLFPRLAEGATLRVWVPACATGEEVYSIAIILQECMDETYRKLDVQIFGTDVDVAAIERARTGLYPENIASDVGADRLGKYFLFEGGRYRVKKGLREMVVFAVHNLLSNPPFSRIDIVSCRNLLIYLDPRAQQRVATVLAYACNPGGLLLLGASESLNQFSEFFSPLDEKARIAERKRYPVPAIGSTGETRGIPSEVRGVRARGAAGEGAGLGWRGVVPEVERFLLDRLAPPTAVINDSGDVIYVHGDTGKYLRPAIGHATNSITSMARKGVKSYISSGILRASKEGKANEVKNIKFEVYGHQEAVNIKVIPVSVGEATEGLLAVVFEEAPKVRSSKRAGRDLAPQECDELKERLSQVEKQLTATSTELEASREEIRSLNEEMESTNEEFQSTSEELETSREELQSVNEELLTVNNELQQRIESLANLNNDMKNLLNNTDVAIIFLDTRLTLRRFTDPATKFMKLVKTDIGRPFATFSNNIRGADLVEMAQKVVDTLRVEEREVQTEDGEWYLMRILPYRTEDSVPDGVVMTFVDISSRKRAEIELYDAALEAKSKAQRLEAILASMSEGLIELDLSGRVAYANDTALRQLEVQTVEDYERALEVRALSGGEISTEDRPLRKVIDGTPISNQEFQVLNKMTRKAFVGSLNGAPVVGQDGKVRSAIVTIREVPVKGEATPPQAGPHETVGKRGSSSRKGAQ